MSTVDDVDGATWVHTKGAPEEVLARCTSEMTANGCEQPLTAASRAAIETKVAERAGQGLRVLAVARRQADGLPENRDDAESGLCLLGLVSLLDAPRPEVADAVARCHQAGIRVIVVTGDNGLTAQAVARRVGIDADLVVTGLELDAMSEAATRRCAHRSTARSSSPATLPKRSSASPTRFDRWVRSWR